MPSKIDTESHLISAIDALDMGHPGMLILPSGDSNWGDGNAISNHKKSF